jgi:hypothetical protein
MRRSKPVQEQLSEIAQERNNYRRSRQLDRLALQMIRNADRKSNSNTVLPSPKPAPTPSTPRAKGYHSFEELSRLFSVK